MVAITDDNIQKIPKHRYFSDNTNNINDELYNKTIILMTVAQKKANGNETLLLMRNSDFLYEVTSQHNVAEVSFNQKMLNALYTNNAETYTAFHNHPDDGPFSLGDVKQILEYDKLVLLVLCTNSCKYSAALYKTNNSKQQINHILARIMQIAFSKNILNMHMDAKKLIKWLVPLGFEYREYRNY